MSEREEKLEAINQELILKIQELEYRASSKAYNEQILRIEKMISIANSAISPGLMQLLTHEITSAIGNLRWDMVNAKIRELEIEVQAAERSAVEKMFTRKDIMMIMWSLSCWGFGGDKFTHGFSEKYKKRFEYEQEDFSRLFRIFGNLLKKSKLAEAEGKS